MAVRRRSAILDGLLCLGYGVWHLIWGAAGLAELAGVIDDAERFTPDLDLLAHENLEAWGTYTFIAALGMFLLGVARSLLASDDGRAT